LLTQADRPTQLPRAPDVNRRKQDRGFTLIELLIVVAVIGIIAGIAIPGLLTSLDKAKQVSTAMLLSGFGKTLELYNSDNGVYPVATSAAELIPLLNPYSDSLKPNDEWKHPVGYTVSTAQDEYTIECFGKDGIDGPNITPETRYIFTLDLVVSGGVFIAGVE
jgi:general secretion pathway protein G